VDALRTCTPELQRLVLERWEVIVDQDRERRAVAEQVGSGRCERSGGGTGAVRMGSVRTASMKMCGQKDRPLGALHRPGGVRTGRDLSVNLQQASEKDMEEAVRQAVHLTSTGDEDEDRRIGEAVSESLRELRGAAVDASVGRAMNGSASKANASESTAGGEGEANRDDQVDIENTGHAGRSDVAVRTDSEARGSPSAPDVTVSGDIQRSKESDPLSTNALEGVVGAKTNGVPKATNSHDEAASKQHEGGSPPIDTDSSPALASTTQPASVDNASYSLQYEVWRRICEAHMGIAPQSKLGVELVEHGEEEGHLGRNRGEEPPHARTTSMTG
jgi:hypothetical protein